MLPDQDSNLDRQDQNLLCCHYTIGQKNAPQKRSAKIILFVFHKKNFQTIFSSCELNFPLFTAVAEVSEFQQYMKKAPWIHGAFQHIYIKIYGKVIRLG